MAMPLYGFAEITTRSAIRNASCKSFRSSKYLCLRICAKSIAAKLVLDPRAWGQAQQMLRSRLVAPFIRHAIRAGGVTFMRLDSPDPASARNVEIGEVELAHFHSLSWTEMAHTLPASRVALTPPPVLAPDAPPVRGAPAAQPGPAPAARRRRIHPAAGLLAGVLVVQTLLSLRLVWSNTAYQDEALYLWAGRLECQHWLHGTPLPDLQAYFSGAPVVYPPLGAAADAVW